MNPSANIDKKHEVSKNPMLCYQKFLLSFELRIHKQRNQLLLIHIDQAEIAYSDSRNNGQC